MAGILAYGVAPAVVGSGILMPIREIIKPEWAQWSSLIVRPEMLFNGEIGRYEGVTVFHEWESEA